MTAISELQKPSVLTGLERLPILQGSGNAGLPLFAQGGLPRGAVVALQLAMVADLSGTSDADPGVGKIRWNHATQDSATQIFVDDADTEASPTDVAALFATLNANGYLYLQAPGKADRAKWQKWQITSITDATGYTKLAVTHVASGDPFEADDQVLLSLQQPDPATALTREPNIQAIVSSATVTPTFDNDLVKITALATALTLANPTGTPIPGLGMAVRIKDNGTARTISFDSQYRAIGVTLPTATVAGKTLYMGMIYNADDTKWDVVAVAQQA